MLWATDGISVVCNDKRPRGNTCTMSIHWNERTYQMSINCLVCTHWAIDRLSVVWNDAKIDAVPHYVYKVYELPRCPMEKTVSSSQRRFEKCLDMNDNDNDRVSQTNYGTVNNLESEPSKMPTATTLGITTVPRIKTNWKQRRLYQSNRQWRRHRRQQRR